MKARFTDHPAIAVIGHLVKDEIKRLDGTISVSLGGAAYNLAALAAIVKTGVIWPVCRIGSDIEGLAAELFSLSPLFDLSGIVHAKRPNVVHRLVYGPDGSRREWNSSRQTPLALSPRLEQCDALLLNFISGSDVRLSDLLIFRKRFRRLIYCDFHSLSLGYNRDHIRYERHHPRWRDYLSASDIIQMNIAELSTICGKAMNNRNAVFETCALLHEAGPQIAIITAGRDGAMMSVSPEGCYYHVPAISIGQEIDATGCGDTLAAAFLHCYLASGDPVKALETANRYAAAKATFSGTRGFREIDCILTQIGTAVRAKRVRIS